MSKSSKKKETNKVLVEGLAKERIVINSEYDKLVETLQDPKYSQQRYTEKPVTIPGDLFARFVNVVGNTKDSLNALEDMLNSANNTINILQNELAKVTLEVGRAHIENVNAGYTTTVEDQNN